jgi:hypothetical protein
VISRPEIVEVPVTVYRPLPANLTDAIPPPPAPPRRCTSRTGQPAVCVDDALSVIPAWEAALQIANDDRRRAALLGGGNGQ